MSYDADYDDDPCGFLDDLARESRAETRKMWARINAAARGEPWDEREPTEAEWEAIDAENEARRLAQEAEEDEYMDDDTDEETN